MLMISVPGLIGKRPPDELLAEYLERLDRIEAA
jgi:hypothetical protein